MNGKNNVTGYHQSGGITANSVNITIHNHSQKTLNDEMENELLIKIMRGEEVDTNISSKPFGNTEMGNTYNNSNHFQGNNYGTLTMTQDNRQKLSMMDEQKKNITKTMRPYSGLEFSIIRPNASQDSIEYADTLRDALKDAGMICIADMPPSMMVPPPSPGVSLIIGSNRENMANALGTVMRQVGLSQKPIKARMVDNLANAFTIVVTRNE